MDGIREFVHELLIAVILQYIIATQVEDRMNQVVLPVLFAFRTQPRIEGCFSESRYQRRDVVRTRNVENHDDLVQQSVSEPHVLQRTQPLT